MAPEPEIAVPDNSSHSNTETLEKKKVVAPSAHFSEIDNIIEYEYETPVDDPENNDKDQQEEKRDDARRRRASHRMSRRESVSGGAAPFDVSYHPGALILYCPPKQRQRWGDSQVLPRVDFGDLFFDLFFVAAAYNTSNILVEATTGQGLLYFLATFYAVMGLWLDKVFYDSRFVVCGDDLFHRVFEWARLAVLATAILHVRTVDIMSDGANYFDTFCFCLMILLGNLLTWFKYIEIYFFGVGQAVIKSESLRWIKATAPFVGLVLAATIVSGLKFYNHTEQSEKYFSSAVEDITNSSYPIGKDDDDHHRILAGASGASSYSTAESYDLPMYLLLGGYILRWLYLIVNIFYCLPTDGSHKDLIVPLNVDFTIHRNGEWNMLMLGESILSLMIVDVDEDKDYYTTFYSSLLTVILLQYLHFRSQPHHADGHALRRHKNAGIGWTLFHQIYSAALISMGAAFTLLVMEYTYAGEVIGDDGHRRFLAGGGGGDGASMDPEDRQQRIAHLFCGSLATIWFCLDAMTLLHLGITNSHNRCQCEHTKSFNVKGIVLLVCRVGLLLFMTTLSQYETDPENLALLGLMGVVLQLALRKLGTMYLSAEQVHALEQEGKLDPESRKWPNVTHAQAHSPNSKGSGDE